MMFIVGIVLILLAITNNDAFLLFLGILCCLFLV